MQKVPYLSVLKDTEFLPFSTTEKDSVSLVSGVFGH